MALSTRRSEAPRRRAPGARGRARGGRRSSPAPGEQLRAPRRRASRGPRRRPPARAAASSGRGEPVDRGQVAQAIASAGGYAEGNLPRMAIEDKDATDLSVAPVVGPDDPRRFTDSGIEIEPLYTEEDLPAGPRGAPRRARRVSPSRAGSTRDMYRERLWTMRQYAGLRVRRGDQRALQLPARARPTGLSMAFDLPTQLGLDSDDPRCLGEVGRTGVAIDTIDDMRRLFDGIPLDEVSTSMTINAPAVDPAAALRARRRGAGRRRRTKLARHDPERHPQGVHRARELHLPARPSMRLTTDTVRLLRASTCRSWNTISISGYHIREKGCSAVQEVAFTLANGDRLRQAAIDGGPRRSTSSRRAWRSSSTPQQRLPGGREVPRRAADVGAASCASASARRTRSRRCCASTRRPAASTLTAQQPREQHRARGAAGASPRSAAARSRCTPTASTRRSRCRPSARPSIALRTQQIIAHESGAADTVDPFAGSYFVEALTDEIERRAQELIEKVDELGGSVKRDHVHQARDRGVRLGLPGALPHRPGRRRRRERVRRRGASSVEDILRVDPESEREQVERLKAFKADRDQAARDARLEELREAARGHRQPAAADPRTRSSDRATIGEVCGAMRDEFGEYTEALASTRLRAPIHVTAASCVGPRSRARAERSVTRAAQAARARGAEPATPDGRSLGPSARCDRITGVARRRRAVRVGDDAWMAIGSPRAFGVLGRAAVEPSCERRGRRPARRIAGTAARLSPRRPRRDACDRSARAQRRGAVRVASSLMRQPSPAPMPASSDAPRLARTVADRRPCGHARARELAASCGRAAADAVPSPPRSRVRQIRSRAASRRRSAASTAERRPAHVRAAVALRASSRPRARGGASTEPARAPSAGAGEPGRGRSPPTATAPRGAALDRGPASRRASPRVAAEHARRRRPRAASAVDRLRAAPRGEPAREPSRTPDAAPRRRRASSTGAREAGSASPRRSRAAPVASRARAPRGT